jgi:hypothetical protein
MINLRALARHLNAERHVAPQHLAPRELARALVEQREMIRAESSDACDDAGRTADLQVGAPDLGPAALQSDAPGHGLGLEAAGARFCAQRAFQAGRGHEEDFEIGFWGHGACITGSSPPDDMFLAA